MIFWKLVSSLNLVKENAKNELEHFQSEFVHTCKKKKKNLRIITCQLQDFLRWKIFFIVLQKFLFPNMIVFEGVNLLISIE